MVTPRIPFDAISRIRPYPSTPNLHSNVITTIDYAIMKSLNDQATPSVNLSTNSKLVPIYSRYFYWIFKHALLLIRFIFYFCRRFNVTYYSQHLGHNLLLFIAPSQFTTYSTLRSLLRCYYFSNSDILEVCGHYFPGCSLDILTTR